MLIHGSDLNFKLHPPSNSKIYLEFDFGTPYDWSTSLINPPLSQTILTDFPNITLVKKKERFNFVDLSIGESGELKSPTINVWDLTYDLSVLIIMWREDFFGGSSLFGVL
ncbi:hypothetical protein STEG23_014933 [Scotinomys teguina]